MTGVTDQLAILDALTGLLEGINPDNDYDYDLRGRVFVGRLIFGNSDPVPVISVVESPRPDPFALSEVQSKLKRLERWELFVQGWAEGEDITQPTRETYLLKGVVEMRLARMAQLKPNASGGLYPEFRLGGLVGEAQIGPGSVRPADGRDVSRPFFFIPLQLTYNRDLANTFV